MDTTPDLESDTFPSELLDGFVEEVQDPSALEFPDLAAVKIGANTFVLRPLADGTMLQLSQKQLIFLTELLATFNPLLASRKAKVPLTTAHRWFQSPKLRAYFNQKRMEIARAQGLDAAMVNAIEFEVLTGQRALRKDQLRVLELVKRQLGLITVGGIHPPAGADEFLFVARKSSARQAPGIPQADPVPNTPANRIEGALTDA